MESEELVPLTSSSHGRVSGKSWKAQKSATLYVPYFTQSGQNIIPQLVERNVLPDTGPTLRNE